MDAGKLLEILPRIFVGIKIPIGFVRHQKQGVKVLDHPAAPDIEDVEDIPLDDAQYDQQHRHRGEERNDLKIKAEQKLQRERRDDHELGDDQVRQAVLFRPPLLAQLYPPHDHINDQCHQQRREKTITDRIHDTTLFAQEVITIRDILPEVHLSECHFTPLVIPHDEQGSRLKNQPDLCEHSYRSVPHIELQVRQRKFDKEIIEQKISEILHLQCQCRLGRIARPEQQAIGAIHDQAANVSHHQTGR